MSKSPKILRPKSGICKGFVKSVSPANNTIVVLIDGVPRPCQWCAGIISGMVGLKTSYYPPQKTEVVVVWPENNDYGYVVAAVAPKYVDGAKPRSSMLDDEKSNYVNKNVFHVQNSQQSRTFLGSKPPVDLAEGELNIENWMGVGLTMLRNLASIQASDLARVECHLLDDMVRIISDTFRHYTAFGDYKISNDGGKLNVVWNGTSHDHEAWGNQHQADPKAKMTSRTNVAENLVAADQSDDGRWRFTQYIGWLGNFINAYVTDPVNTIGKIAEGQFRSGKAHIHINDDGAVLVQSVADIVLEKVVRIPVPNQIRKEDDPKGELSDAQLGNTDFLKTWNPSSSNLFEMAFQLREYARWLNNTHTLSRFHQMPRDWQIPSEDQTPAPDVNSGTPDKAEVNTGVSNWKIAYSTIRIYRDGSIQTVDAYGNAITTTAVGIQISSARDIFLQAGGSVNIVAGRDINLVARKNIGLTAATEAIRFRAQTAIMGFCLAGNILWEVAGGFWHRLIGPLTANNSFSVQTSGQVSTKAAVNAVTVAAAQVFQSNPFKDKDSNGDTELNHTWVGTADIELDGNTENFQYQSDYGASKIYQTITQQMLKLGDAALTNGTQWRYTTYDGGRGAAWPGASVQELTTAAGEKLNTPSKNTKFSEKPQPMQLQLPTMLVE